jgi:predicted RNA-binding protein with PUA-like domain
MQHWLVKSEPNVYSIDDLARDGRTFWDGVRNYTARNTMRDAMKLGDPVLFYHSSIEPTGLVGLAKVCREGYPDFTQFDAGHHHYDPDARGNDPRWYMVDIEFVAKFPRLLTLAELKADAALAGMPLLQKGQRLSVMPVSPAHYEHVIGLAGL